MASSDILKLDIENRNATYTITSTVIGAMTTVEVKDGATLIAKSKSPSLYASMQNVRANIVGSLIVLPRITTTQRDTITGLVAGEFIVNTTTNVAEIYDGTTWNAA